MVDYGLGDQAIGLEVTAPGRMTVSQINAVLRSLDLSPVREEDLPPLRPV